MKLDSVKPLLERDLHGAFIPMSKNSSKTMETLSGITEVTPSQKSEEIADSFSQDENPFQDLSSLLYQFDPFEPKKKHDSKSHQCEDNENHDSVLNHMSSKRKDVMLKTAL